MAEVGHEKRTASIHRSASEEYWYPNKDESEEDAGRDAAADYFSFRTWDTDEITTIPPMRFTDNPSRHNVPRNNLQICSIKIASITGGLQWPPEVYGMVTARDVLELDRKRNIIYARTRSNCQTITEKDPYLALTGPTRAIVTCTDPGKIEIVLKAKGATESEDRDLSFLVLPLKSHLYCTYDKDYTSRRSTLHLTFRHIAHAVEATISVRLIGGSSLPSGVLQGAFTASTASVEDGEVLLLAFKDGKLPIADDGTINLSRRVVSVGYGDRDLLKVAVVTQCANDGQDSTRDEIDFVPQSASRSYGELTLGVCKMQVTVAWSLFDY